MASAIKEFAPAKVNLYLHIVGRRSDGYHLLDSLAVFACIGDMLRAEPDESLSLALEGPFAAGLASESDNLVLRAARALAREAGISPHARLTLDKRLPVASGIGGGSADAAATIRALCRLWALTPDAPVLERLAVGLGADVPVCLGGRSTRMEGIGEILSPAPLLPACGLLLVNPGVAVATPEVFRARCGDFSPRALLPARWGDAASMAADLAALRNDLQPPAILLRPVIADVLAAISALDGCLVTRMSGSGATCFGLFPTAEAAAHAASMLSSRGWWCWGGGLHAADGVPVGSA
ncbi:MAG: 4-(cytidine 5'-diphospho)-2-C-methyl-D-erythritol kinase [Acetobacteraceae bacterium]